MKPLVLHDHELEHLLTLEKGQTFMLARPMEPQPEVNKRGNQASWSYAGVTCHNAADKLTEYLNDAIDTISPFGPPGSEFFAYDDPMADHLYPVIPTNENPRLLSIKLIGTECKRVQEVSMMDTITMGVTSSQHEKQWESNHGDKHPWTDNPWAWLPTFEVMW